MGEQPRFLKYGRIDMAGEHDSIDRNAWDGVGDRVKPTRRVVCQVDCRIYRSQLRMEIRGQAWWRYVS